MNPWSNKIWVGTVKGFQATVDDSVMAFTKSFSRGTCNNPLMMPATSTWYRCPLSTIWGNWEPAARLRVKLRVMETADRPGSCTCWRGLQRQSTCLLRLMESRVYGFRELEDGPQILISSYAVVMSSAFPDLPRVVVRNRTAMGWTSLKSLPYRFSD